MPEQVEFINRERELAFIDDLINRRNSSHFLLIQGEGGVGKTRLLQEVRDRNKKKTNIAVLDIIDFDDRINHTPVNVGLEIGKQLDVKVFEPYFKGIADYQKMERAGVSKEELAKKFKEDDQLFIKCFNKVSEKKRVVILLDTIDILVKADLWRYLIEMGAFLNNTIILMAGRKAEEMYEKYFQEETIKDKSDILKIKPFDPESGKKYLQEKMKILKLSSNFEIEDTLINLSQGYPILIDLAVELIAHEKISPTWIKECKLEDFECKLVSRIAQLRSEMDRLTLLMSWVYPLNVKMIATLLNIEKNEAEKLFHDAQAYVFVKSLPNDYITLHDEMRRMVNEYVWPEADPEKDRRSQYSKSAIDYIDGCLFDNNRQLKKVLDIYDDPEADLEVSRRLMSLDNELWKLKADYLTHMMFLNTDNGFKYFIKKFDEATKKRQLDHREILLHVVKNYEEMLSPEQKSEFYKRRIDNLLHKGRYEEAKKLTEKNEELQKIAVQRKENLPPKEHDERKKSNKLLEIAKHKQRIAKLPQKEGYEEKDKQVSVETQVSAYIDSGNVSIRLGNVIEGISNFNEALKISQENNLLTLCVKSLNALGWAYRLTGDSERAKEYYLEARKLLLENDEAETDNLKELDGWILNNLAFVYSNNNDDRKKSIDIARSAVQHWKELGNDIGLGAAYLVRGIAYYRNDMMDKGLEALQNALDIFKPLGFDDWLGRIYSWRGAIYQDKGKDFLNEAEKDLKQSLEIGSHDIKAMTLNRLARVYMTQGEWDLAERTMEKALAAAKEIPDYVYWLGSIARLAAIASEKKEFEKLVEFEQMLDDCLIRLYENGVKLEKNSLGIAMLSLAKLAFGQNEKSKSEPIVGYMQKGIELVTEYGSYGRTDIRTRLKDVEKVFPNVNIEIIHVVGKRLEGIFRKKEIEDISYSLVTQNMKKWANWKA